MWLPAATWVSVNELKAAHQQASGCIVDATTWSAECGAALDGCVRPARSGATIIAGGGQLEDLDGICRRIRRSGDDEARRMSREFVKGCGPQLLRARSADRNVNAARRENKGVTRHRKAHKRTGLAIFTCTPRLPSLRP
jgi:hypothetical protein